MKVIQINATCGMGSTGKICVAVSKLLSERDVDNRILYTMGDSEYPLSIKYSGYSYKKIQALKSRVLGNGGFNSEWATRKLIKELEIFNPDIVHIHNIHSHDCNIKMLFDYLRSKNIRLLWTFHDCWAFTANCTHFTIEGCNKWKTKCEKCIQIRRTSWLLDNSEKLFAMKKKSFLNQDITIITPSVWLSELVKESFLGSYPTYVINNGIDLSIFKPTDSDIRKKLSISNEEFLILGVAYDWGFRKGIDVFIKMARILPSKFRIVMVGTNKHIDRILPKNIISINRTENQKELAKLYSAADLFVNPTREENYPTTHLESIACGTPVLSFDTGGCKEMIKNGCGKVVPYNDIDLFIDEVKNICEKNIFSSKDCIESSSMFDEKKCYEGYLKLYGLH